MAHLCLQGLTTEEYERYYLDLSDARLVHLIDHPTDIEPVALDAARRELVRRGMTGEQLQVYRDMHLRVETERARTAQRNMRAKDRLVDAGGAVYDLLVSPEAPRTDHRQFQILTLALAMPFLVLLPRISSIGWISEYGMDAGAFMYFLPLVWLPCSMFLLWKRTSAGLHGRGLHDLDRLRVSCAIWLTVGRVGEGPSILGDLFPETDLGTALLTLGVQGALVFLFQMRRSTSLFGIDPLLRWGAIALALVGGLLEVY